MAHRIATITIDGVSIVTLLVCFAVTVAAVGEDAVTQAVCRSVLAIPAAIITLFRLRIEHSIPAGDESCPLAGAVTIDATPAVLLSLVTLLTKVGIDDAIAAVRDVIATRCIYGACGRSIGWTASFIVSTSTTPASILDLPTPISSTAAPPSATSTASSSTTSTSRTCYECW